MIPPKTYPANMVGETFGAWLVCAPSELTERGHRSPSRAMFRCRCATCKGERMLRRGAIVNGWAGPCRRCEAANAPLKPVSAARKRGAPLPQVGERFHAWTVTGHAYARGDGGPIICLIQCECGMNSKAQPSKLRRGVSVRCVSCAAKLRRATEPKPRVKKPAKPKPIKVVADKPARAPMQRSTAAGRVLADVPLPEVWNSRTIDDLMRRRAARWADPN